MTEPVRERGEHPNEVPQEFIQEILERGGKEAEVLVSMFTDIVDPTSIEIAWVSKSKRNPVNDGNTFIEVPPYVSGITAKTKQAFGGRPADLVLDLPSDHDLLSYYAASMHIGTLIADSHEGINALSISVGRRGPSIERHGLVSQYEGLDGFLREKMIEADTRIRTIQSGVETGNPS